MEPNETLRKMREMKLLGMADAFAAQLADRLTYDALPAETRVGMLVDAELDRRQSTRLENLLKGASGTAVHNMNLLFGLPERTGLRLKASAF